MNERMIETKKIIYRVILKVSYHYAHFEFEKMEDACAFADTILWHMVDSEDQKRPAKVTIELVDTEAERKAEEEKESEGE